MAEQMLEKDREIANLKNTMELEKDNKRRRKKNNRVRDLEAQVMSLITKLREAEMDKDQIEHKLNEKEEEGRIKGRKISELIFKLQVEEEAKARVQEESSELTKQLARHSNSSTETSHADTKKLKVGDSSAIGEKEVLKETGGSVTKDSSGEGSVLREKSRDSTLSETGEQPQ